MITFVIHEENNSQRQKCTECLDYSKFAPWLFHFIVPGRSYLMTVWVIYNKKKVNERKKSK